MRALSDITLGSVLALGLACSLLTPGCGTAVTPQLVQCKLESLRVLPKDVKMVTPYDIEDLYGRLKACDGAAKSDAGAP